jgi:phosphoglycerate dehydrogenase-like enzyme
VRRHLTTPCEIVVASEVGILPRLPEIDLLVTMGLTTEMARVATRLKLVQVPGAGVDRIDRSALPEGAFLANTYGHETGIAEYVIGAMLAQTREFSRLDGALRKGDWQSQWAVGTPPPPVWSELAGQTVDILGYGRIGQNIARRARAFDMQVRAIRRDVGQSRGDALALLGGPEMIADVLRRADYVVIGMPATVETTGSIGRRELALMKLTAFLINVAPAEIVDENALYEALAERSIAGGGARRLVSLSARCGTDATGEPPLSQVAERADDAACLRLGRPHARRARQADRGKYPARCSRRAAA